MLVKRGFNLFTRDYSNNKIAF